MSAGLFLSLGCWGKEKAPADNTRPGLEDDPPGDGAEQAGNGVMLAGFDLAVAVLKCGGQKDDGPGSGHTAGALALLVIALARGRGEQDHGRAVSFDRQGSWTPLEKYLAGKC
jgi:hypothetical protein